MKADALRRRSRFHFSPDRRRRMTVYRVAAEPGERPAHLGELHRDRDRAGRLFWRASGTLRLRLPAGAPHMLGRTLRECSATLERLLA